MFPHEKAIQHAKGELEAKLKSEFKYERDIKAKESEGLISLKDLQITTLEYKIKEMEAQIKVLGQKAETSEKSVTNPFKFGSIVSGDYFYNREEDLLRIKQTLAGGNNITLFAPRRFGKSLLVKKVFNAIAHNERELLSGEAAQKYNLGAVSTTQKALESFIDDGLVERNNTQYEFSDPFFKMFVLKNI